MPHGSRPPHAKAHPVHVTMRAGKVSSLRSERIYREFRRFCATIVYAFASTSRHIRTWRARDYSVEILQRENPDGYR